MNRHSNRRLALVAACGASFGLAGVAAAQPWVINVTGATLQQNFFESLGATADFINVDGETGDTRSVSTGNFTLATQIQLATAGLPLGATTTSSGWPIDTATGTVPWWQVTYRAVGSGNGLLELSRFGLTAATNPNDLLFSVAAPADLNRVAYVAAGVPNSRGNTGNPGAAPIRGVLVSSPAGPRYQATFNPPNTGSTGGLLMDIAPVDVIPEYFVAIAGPADINKLPGQPGYGNCPTTAVTINGTTANFLYAGEASPRPFANAFGALANGVDTVATHGGPVLPTDTSTIFSVITAYNSVAAVTNFGTGKSQATFSELRHLSATGRLPSGENLTWINRDADSGTRNAFTSPLRLDPSWAVGENIGALTVLNDTADLGVSANGRYQPSNKGSSGALERTLFNTRLGIGTSGSERGSGSAWLTNGTAEVLAVKDDIGVRDANGNVVNDPVTGTPLVGTDFVRPTLTAVSKNGYRGQLDPRTGLPYATDGYRIASLATFNTIGDPRMAPASKGGYGYSATDPVGVNNPPMRNVEAAAFVNNVTRSIDAYVINNSSADFSPVDFLVRNFLLPQAVDRIPTPTNPTAFIVNPNLNGSVQDDAPNRSRLANNAYRAFGNGSASVGRPPNGAVPRRNVRPSGTYSDGLAGNTYQTLGGTNLTGGTVSLNTRNRVSGDFNGDGVRDAGDIVELVRAYRFRYEGGAWAPLAGTGAIAGAPGADICPEIIGDFDGNGSFDKADVRYFVDGLALNGSGVLDRGAAFTALDNAYFAANGNGNFFGTTLATGATYAAGDSRADVANATGRQTPGFAPIGADGGPADVSTVPLAQRNVVDAFDINYIYKQFKQNARAVGGAVRWTNLSEAVGADLSCDMNGDLVINQADVDVVVRCVLKTTYGDVNLDGVSSYADFAIARSHLGQPGGWAEGDVDGDGMVTLADLDLIKSDGRVADFNNDGFVDPDDLSDYIGCFFTLPPCADADINADGFSDPDDLSDFIGLFFGTQPTQHCP